jgi:hypothetical protein
MQVKTLCFTQDGGWSERFPSLDSPRTLVLLFGYPGLADDPSPLAPLSAAFPKAKFLGCSTAGEIVGSSVRDDSISVAIVRFDATEIRTASAMVAGPGDCEPAGMALADALRAPDLTSVLLLSDGLNVNGSDLVRGLNERLPAHVVVTGGLAGDGERFRRTWVLEHRQPRRHRVVAVGFYGATLRVGHGSRGGWDSYGPVQKVTRSDGNVLYEVDGLPALRVYKHHMGDMARGLPASALMFPLSLKRGSGEPLVRTILAIDEATQSMTFAGDVPQGSDVQFMRADLERLINGANQAARMAGLGPGNANSDASLTIAISCVGRRLVLGDRAQNEVAAITESMPKAGALVGFYSYGEISPHGSGRSELHNQTMTLTQLSESG